MNHINPNVQIVFLPAHTTSLIQPMDQGVISTLKAYYRRNTFSKAHETHDTLVEFFKDFTVLDAVNNFGDAWKEISEKNMRGVWEPLLKRKEAPTEIRVDEIVSEIVNLGTATDFELTAEDVQESLTFDTQDMTNEDLYEIAQPRVAEADENEEIPENPENPAELSYKQLREILRKGQDFNDFVRDLDPIVERHSKITKDFDNLLKCYKEEALEKEKKAVKQSKQSKLENFFSKAVQNSNPGPSGQKSSTVDEDSTFETSSIEDEEEEKDEEFSSDENVSSDED